VHCVPPTRRPASPTPAALYYEANLCAGVFFFLDRGRRSAAPLLKRHGTTDYATIEPRRRRGSRIESTSYTGKSLPAGGFLKGNEMLGDYSMVNVVPSKLGRKCGCLNKYFKCRSKPAFSIFGDDGATRSSRYSASVCARHLPIAVRRVYLENQKNK